MLYIGGFFMNKKKVDAFSEATHLCNDSISFVKYVDGMRVLFVTTKNIDYIRNTQEIKMLENEAHTVKKVYSDRKNYIGRIIEIWFKLLTCKSSDFDCVFIGFSPQLVFPFFWKFRKKKIIIDFFISVYDTLINDRKKIKKEGLAAAFCHRLDAYVIKKSDIVIADTKADRDYFINEFSEGKDKFEVLYLEADKTVYYPRAKDNQKYHNKFVVLYFGSILPLQGVDIVLETVKLLKNYDDIVVQMIGPIPNSYDKPIQDNVEYIEWLPQEELAIYIANADLCLAGHFNANIDKAKRTIPGKAYIYNAMDKTMILGDNAANRERFNETSKCQFIQMGNAEKLKNEIITLSLKNKALA